MNSTARSDVTHALRQHGFSPRDAANGQSIDITLTVSEAATLLRWIERQRAESACVGMTPERLNQASEKGARFLAFALREWGAGDAAALIERNGEAVDALAQAYRSTVGRDG